MTDSPTMQQSESVPALAGSTTPTSSQSPASTGSLTTQSSTSLPVLAPTSVQPVSLAGVLKTVTEQGQDFLDAPILRLLDLDPLGVPADQISTLVGRIRQLRTTSQTLKASIESEADELEPGEAKAKRKRTKKQPTPPTDFSGMLSALTED